MTPAVKNFRDFVLECGLLLRTNFFRDSSQKKLETALKEAVILPICRMTASFINSFMCSFTYFLPAYASFQSQSALTFPHIRPPFGRLPSE